MFNNKNRKLMQTILEFRKLQENPVAMEALTIHHATGMTSLTTAHYVEQADKIIKRLSKLSGKTPEELFDKGELQKIIDRLF